jgi:hypothetical protein
MKLGVGYQDVERRHPTARPGQPTRTLDEIVRALI